MGSFSIWHWVVVAIVVVIVFGTKNLPNIGRDIGRSIRGFKEGMRINEDDDDSSSPEKEEIYLTEKNEPGEEKNFIPNGQRAKK